jgi:hypothetical protein
MKTIMARRALLWMSLGAMSAVPVATLAQEGPCDPSTFTALRYYGIGHLNKIKYSPDGPAVERVRGHHRPRLVVVVQRVPIGDWLEQRPSVALGQLI